MTAPAECNRPGGAALWAALAACSLLLFWIAESASVFDSAPGEAWHHYEFLVDGFLHGHTSLSVEPAPELLRLKDPYDPAQNGPWRLWDASLYQGKFYLYFGPTPVLVMLPWRVLTGHHLPQRLAVALFASAGLAALATLLSEVRRRHFPSVGPAAAGLVLATAMAAAWLPVTLRRPDVWELPVVAAVACLWWALYFLWRCLGSGGGLGWAIAIGAMVALMMGARPTDLLAGSAVLALLLPLRRPVLAAGAVAVAGGLALLAYNHARFGSFAEFGQSYQLWGADERGVRHFSAAYAAHNAWVYLLSLPSLSPYFPFVLAVPPGGEPPGYLGIDEIHGGLIAVPAQLAALAALAWAWRERRRPEALPLRRTIAAAALCSLMAACVLFCFAGAVTRYSTELFAGSTVAAAVGLMALLGGEGGGALARLGRPLALCACTWTLVFSALASAENRILFRKTNPALYRAAAHLLDYPSLWYARAHGVAYGPIGLTVRLGPFRGPTATVLVSNGRAGMVNQLLLERPDAGHARLILAVNGIDGILATPVFETAGGAVRARVEAPWLYPPPQHPWWDGVADAKLREELRTRFVLESGQAEVATRDARVFDATGFGLRVALRGSEGSEAAWIEALEPLPVPAR